MLSITNDDFILFIITMIFVGIGVFGKDYSNTISGKDRKINYFRIVFVIVTISTLILAARDFFTKFNDFFYLFVCITAGWMNYSLPSLLDNLGENIIRWVKEKFGDIFGKQDKIDKLVKEIQDIKNQNKEIIKNQEELEDKINHEDENDGN